MKNILTNFSKKKLPNLNFQIIERISKKKIKNKIMKLKRVVKDKYAQNKNKPDKKMLILSFLIA